MDIREFIVSNWKWIVEIACGLIFFIILMCKKKVKIIDYLTDYLLYLPTLIYECEYVEKIKGKDNKFTWVFSRSVQYLMNITGLSNDEIVAKYAVVINNAIENILKCPQSAAERNKER